MENHKIKYAQIYLMKSKKGKPNYQNSNKTDLNNERPHPPIRKTHNPKQTSKHMHLNETTKGYETKFGIILPPQLTKHKSKHRKTK